MKKLFTLFILFIGIFVMTACSKSNETNNDLDSTETTTIAPTDVPSTDQTPTGQVINIGILPAESAIPIILAEEKGFFDEYGVKVSIKSFSSPNDRNVALQSKELDASIGDVMTAAAFVDKGLSMKITSDINEDFKILSSPESGITKLEDLSDKRISLVPNFILEYIMDQFATEYGFSYEIVEIPSFPGRSEALMANQIDGVVFTEPQAGMLVEQGAHLLGSSKEAGIKGGTIMFTEDMITNRPGDIKAFYDAYNKAMDYMNKTDVSEYSTILTNYQFPEAINGYLSDLVGNFEYAGTISKDQYDSIIAWTNEKGLISKIYDYEELTDFSFIQ